MFDRNSKSLREALAADYQGLAKRLTRCLGSADVAHETLHETFLKVDRVSDAVEIRSPVDYLFRIALNVAKDRNKKDRHLLSAGEVAAIMDVVDDRPDPAIVAESRMEIAEFQKALGELPQRRREVFIAAHLEQIPHRDIAQRFGINIRTVEFDIQHAMEYLSRRLGRRVVRRYGPRPKPRAVD
ncbi:sigma-24 (FecI-like) [Rhodopseudomonas palustris HaA2]|uniref:Sigma-24 (FecI-like) n=1 Tax=Rhodopseudomonas palustris (strain HaA2) TaxID=316058 RepID=Q2IXY8_RHOP2|nr:RNA polymerase sigma factor [Rhodopseudomonas palustris]ABD06922.1 sigma-24 (FecI-like) [Rhodopseudomonas palustris HaA2]